MTSGAWIDTHAHLQDEKLRDDLDALLARARESGVVGVIVMGTTAADSAEGVAMSSRHPELAAAVGVHPNHAAEASPGDWERVVALADAPGVVAIGETGLDRHWDFTPFETQREWFDRHLGLAEARGMPVVIHCRESEDDVIAALSKRPGPIRGVLHSFTGDWDRAKRFLELGLHLSFAGMLTFPNKSLAGLRDAAARVPIDRLLVETDSPYLSPHPHRGRRNEPARVVLTGAFLAALRGVSPEDLANATTRNARRLFRLPEPTTSSR
jgi:TatD DNase family protein